MANNDLAVPFYKKLTANHEYESDIMEDFVLSLRVMVNPRDRLNLSALAKRWKISAPAIEGEQQAPGIIRSLASLAGSPRSLTVADALAAIAAKT